MSHPPTFDEALDTVERLSPELQADLIEVIRHRLNEQGRARVIATARQSAAEHDQGLSRATSAQDLMQELTE